MALNSGDNDADVSGRRQRELLAVRSYDGSIALYNVVDARRRATTAITTATTTTATGSGSADPVLVLEGPSNVEFGSFHSRGGTMLLAGSVADGTVMMYHVPLGRTCMQVFVGHNGGVTGGLFTPDRMWAVTVGQEDGTFRVWAPKTGVCRHVFGLMEGGAGEDGGDGEEDGGASGGRGLTCLAMGGGHKDSLQCVEGRTDARTSCTYRGRSCWPSLITMRDPPRRLGTTSWTKSIVDDFNLIISWLLSVELN
ncbi:hypothetical protein ACHAW5_005400 [Stephanodiscus triporus]|uniref:Uncharacterized protein n=1 Tax=Stephanodiscus triporus TaxID=2934178 RepID=A0ABD3QFM0_9STRA